MVEGLGGSKNNEGESMRGFMGQVAERKEGRQEVREV